MSRQFPRVPRQCEICQRHFQALVCNVNRGKGKTCSVQCRVVKAAKAERKPHYPEWFPSSHLGAGKRHPLQTRAMRLVRKAIRRGDLEQGTSCSNCGKHGRPDAHHEDYRRPLDVVWLCRSCHQRRHFDGWKETGVAVGALPS